MSYEIENDVPMPAGPVKERLPVGNMNIGSSVVVEAKSRKAATMRLKATAFHLRLPFKFTSSPIGDGKFRVWRIA